MKKLALIATLILAATAASAADIGVRVGRNGGSATNNMGVTVGEKVGIFGVEASADRSTIGTNNVNRFGLTGSYDVVKVAGISFATKAGVAFIDPIFGDNGYAGTVGIGATYPLTTKLTMVTDYSYQRGQARVREFNGNQVSVGAKYSF